MALRQVPKIQGLRQQRALLSGVSLSPESVQEIKEIAARYVKDPEYSIPGTSIAITNASGDLLLEHATGITGLESRKPMTPDNVFWMASCSKMVAALLVLQSVERGLVKLDDPADVEKWCPELTNIPVFKELAPDGTVTLVPKKSRITLRQLLSHTAGFGYGLFSKRLAVWNKMFHLNELDGSPRGVAYQPLLFEPGTVWSYGTGIDWAMNVVARAENKSFDELLVEGLCKPLDCQNMRVVPPKEVKDKLVDLHLRDVDTNKLTPIPQLRSYSLSDDPAIQFLHDQSGGSSVFAKPSEYVRIFAALLNKGVYEPTGQRILQPATIDEIFANHIPKGSGHARQKFTVNNANHVDTLPDFFPRPGNPPKKWGLAFQVTPDEMDYGRGADTGFWVGLANSFYWIDRKNGVAGFINTQIIPFGDTIAGRLWIEIEKAVYRGLQK